ncbi:hypothetical protein RJ035_004115 [Blastomyces gilchristii]
MPGSESSNNDRVFEPEEVPISSCQWPTSPSPASPSPALLPPTTPVTPAAATYADDDYSTQLSVLPAFQSSQSTSQSTSQTASQTASQSRLRISWSSAMDEAMLLGLLDAKKDGWETDNGNFKTYGWNMAVEAVRRATYQTVNKNNLDNRWRSNKHTWQLWMKHKNQISGWTWCADRETYINDPEVMNEYFQHHPDMVIFQHQGPAFRELNEQLLDGKLATGQYAVGSRAMRRQLGIDDDLYPPSSSASNYLPRVSGTTADSPSPERKRLRKGKNEAYAEPILGLGSVLREMNKEILNALREVPEKAPEKATRLFLQEVNEILPEDWKDSDEVIPYRRYAAILRIFASNPAMAQVYLGFSNSSKEQRCAFIMDILEE